MKSTVAVFLILAVLGAMLFNTAEALDCRKVLNRVDCSQADGPSACDGWCRAYAWSTGVCTMLTASCPGKASGSSACYCD
ncbi:hypothetical protein AAVH_27263 [Aphelenchoides avenae]|nr:hypothetical protein AAVH_27263 [Aphelenchus avenae]